MLKKELAALGHEVTPDPTMMKQLHRSLHLYGHKRDREQNVP